VHEDVEVMRGHSVQQHLQVQVGQHLLIYKGTQYA
jgi:hypothetical protein